MTDLEHKEFSADLVGAGFKVLDEDQGIVEALVAVTGVVDRVKDVALAGSSVKTLGRRKPKGVWGHDWHSPISRTIEADELMPGDSRLPTETKGGDPWPPEAGAVRVVTQFNLDTQRGREAFSDVKFYGDEQEWSVGYKVNPAETHVERKSGVRQIGEWEIFEYSPVLFGAAPLAMTMSVKDEVATLATEDDDDLSEEDVLEIFDDALDSKISKEQLDEWKRTGVSLPDGAFPIPNVTYLRKAIRAYGRAGIAGKERLDRVRRHIIKRARSLDRVDLLPPSWDVKGEGGEDEVKAAPRKHDFRGRKGAKCVICKMPADDPKFHHGAKPAEKANPFEDLEFKAT